MPRGRVVPALPGGLGRVWLPAVRKRSVVHLHKRSLAPAPHQAALKPELFGRLVRLSATASGPELHARAHCAAVCYVELYMDADDLRDAAALRMVPIAQLPRAGAGLLARRASTPRNVRTLRQTLQHTK